MVRRVSSSYAAVQTNTTLETLFTSAVAVVTFSHDTRRARSSDIAWLMALGRNNCIFWSSRGVIYRFGYLYGREGKIGE